MHFLNRRNIGQHCRVSYSYNNYNNSKYQQQKQDSKGSLANNREQWRAFVGELGIRYKKCIFSFITVQFMIKILLGQIRVLDFENISFFIISIFTLDILQDLYPQGLTDQCLRSEASRGNQNLWTKHQTRTESAASSYYYIDIDYRRKMCISYNYYYLIAKSLFKEYFF